MVQYGTVWYSMVQYGSVWLGMVGYGRVKYIATTLLEYQTTNLIKNLQNFQHETAFFLIKLDIIDKIASNIAIGTPKMKLRTPKAFCSESSIHGIPYFSNNDINLSEKVFWAVVTIISFICCLLLIGKIMVMVKEDLTVTYTSDNSVPVTQIPFPSVTVCFELMHFGNVTYSRYHVVKEQLENGEITVDDLTEDELRTLQAISLVISDDFLLHYNVSRIPTDDIADQIEAITLSLRHLIVTSTFSDIYATLFSKIVGPSGICYNFNMVDAQNLYKNIKNSPKMFKYVHNILYFTRVEKFLRSPMQYKDLNLSNPLKLTLADSHFELRILKQDKTMRNTLDNMLNTYDYYKFASPRVYINNPYEIYNRDFSSYYSNRYSKVMYVVEPKQILIDDNLKDYGPDARGCYFVADGIEHGEDERNLKYFNIYTKGNCKQECLINRTLEVCGCVQFFMIRDESTRVCGIHDMACYKDVEAEQNSEDLCKCYPSCGEIVYNVQRIIPDYVKRVPLEFFSEFLEKTRKDNVDSCTIVKFRSISYFPYVLKRQFTEIDFIAYTGGAFGLFLGCFGSFVLDFHSSTAEYHHMRCTRSLNKPQLP
ncbi:sodium channel protein Nach-like isoform X2 [Chironomus tepperi]|uniref:sodium channel protein Nach-like isoform X2 n=1 Tax=Chironomus tepperi TaxID=113505 RepID=UPI00391F5AC1